MFQIIDVKSQSIVAKQKLHLNSQNFNLQCFQVTQTCNYIFISFGHKHLNQGQVFVFQFNGRKITKQFQNNINKNITAAQFCIHNNLLLGTMNGEILICRISTKKQFLNYQLIQQLQASMSLTFVNIQPNKIQSIIVDEFDTQDFHLIMINIVCGITIHIFIQQAYDIEDIQLTQNSEYMTSENLDWCKSQSQLPELLFVQKFQNRIYYLVQQMEQSKLNLSYIEYDEQAITKTYLEEMYNYIQQQENISRQQIDQNMIQQYQLEQISLIQGITTLQVINLQNINKINQIQAFSVSKYHTLIQSNNILYVNSTINGELVQQIPNQDTPKYVIQYSPQDIQNQNMTFQFANLYLMFLTKDQTVSCCEILNEESQIYKIYVKTNQYDLALQFCKTEQEKDMILHNKYNYLLSKEQYIEAGILLSQIETDDQKIILELSNKQLFDVLINYLQQRLLEQNEKNNNKILLHYLIQTLSELIIKQQSELQQIQSQVQFDDPRITELHQMLNKQILTDKALSLKLNKKLSFYKNFQVDIIESYYNEPWFNKQEMFNLAIENKNNQLIKTLINLLDNDNENQLLYLAQQLKQNDFQEGEKLILQKLTINQLQTYIINQQIINDNYIQLLGQKLDPQMDMNQFSKIILLSNQQQIKYLSEYAFNNDNIIQKCNYHIAIKLFISNQTESNLIQIWNNFKNNKLQQNQIYQIALKNKYYNLLQIIYYETKKYEQYISISLLQIKQQNIKINLFQFVKSLVEKIGQESLQLILEQSCKQITYDIEDAIKILEFIFYNTTLYQRISNLLLILLQNLTDTDQITLMYTYQNLFNQLIQTQQRINQQHNLVTTKIEEEPYLLIEKQYCDSCGKLIDTDQFSIFKCGHIYCDKCRQNTCTKCSNQYIDNILLDITY